MSARQVVTARGDRSEPSPEAAACTVKGPANGWYQRPCNEVRASRYVGGTWEDDRRPGAAARPCARDGCPHHVHAWARADARYCSGTCRMAALRGRKPAVKA